MLPATRITKRSPSPWSNTISAGTRESEQPRMMANGSWPAATCVRRRPVRVSEPRVSDMKRRLPSRRRSSASRGGIIEASFCRPQLYAIAQAPDQRRQGSDGSIASRARADICKRARTRLLLGECRGQLRFIVRNRKHLPIRRVERGQLSLPLRRLGGRAADDHGLDRRQQFIERVEERRMRLRILRKRRPARAQRALRGVEIARFAEQEAQTVEHERRNAVARRG